jgi:hypothetical protein
MPMPTPPAPQPAPVPTPVVKAPEPPPNFSGTVRLVTFSEIIASGEGQAKPKNGIDFDRIDQALKRLSGVSSVSFNDATATIEVGYGGPWSDLAKVKNTVSACGVSAEVVNPARVVYRPTVIVEDESKAVAALKAVAGVHYVCRESNDLVIYCDLAVTLLDSIRSSAEGAGLKGMINSHEEIRVPFTTQSGNLSALLEDLARTKWVLKTDQDGSNVRVLAVKGRITKALVKSLMTRHGVAESK